MSKKSLLIAAVAILVIAIIGITYLLFTEKKANRELVQEFQLDKEDEKKRKCNEPPDS